MSTDQILSERGKTHGKFEDNAKIMQAHKRLGRQEGKNWAGLHDVQKEALEMIYHKIGRILTGDPDVLDHWDDISGYAVLVSKWLRERNLGK